MFKSTKDKPDTIEGIKPEKNEMSFITKLNIAVRKMLITGEIKSDSNALYYLVAINSDTLIILKSDDKSYFEITDPAYMNTISSENEPELTKVNIMNMGKFRSKSETLKHIKNSLVNQENFFVTLADGVEMFIRYNEVFSFSIKRIYSYEQLRKIIKAREDDLEIGGWTDELAEHVEQWFRFYNLFMFYMYYSRKKVNYET